VNLVVRMTHLAQHGAVGDPQLTGDLPGGAHDQPRNLLGAHQVQVQRLAFGILVGVLGVVVARAVGPSVWGSIRSRRRVD